MDKFEENKVFNSVFKIISNRKIPSLTIPYQDESHGKSIGAGFFINNKGLALTASHVVENNIELWIILPEYGQMIFTAEIISVYPDFDIALIKVNIKNKFFLKLSSSDNLKLRTTVYTIGYPSNPKYPIATSGTISGVRDDYLQTDTPVNSGNSGGPLLNEDNEVIGITSAVLSETENSSLIIPINIYKRISTIMLQHKIIYKNVLGIVFSKNTDNYLNFFVTNEFQNLTGVIITKILNNSPLFKKIEVDDLLCSITHNNNTYEIDNYGEITVNWVIGKITIDKLIKRFLNNEEITVHFYSHKEEKMKKEIMNLIPYDKLYPIKKLFFPVDSLDYEIFAGVIFMDLTINHLSLEKFSHLGTLLLNDEIYNPQLVITHIFPNSIISKTSNLTNFSLVKKINNMKVSSLVQLREAIKHPVCNKKGLFIIIENNLFERVILDCQEIIDEVEKLNKQYKIKL